MALPTVKIRHYIGDLFGGELVTELELDFHYALHSEPGLGHVCGLLVSILGGFHKASSEVLGLDAEAIGRSLVVVLLLGQLLLILGGNLGDLLLQLWQRQPGRPYQR